MRQTICSGVGSLAASPMRKYEMAPSKHWNSLLAKAAETPSHTTDQSTRLSNVVCQNIADFVCSSRPWLPLSREQVSTKLVQDCVTLVYTTSSNDAWTDYIRSIATALNPLPPATSYTRPG